MGKPLAVEYSHANAKFCNCETLKVNPEKTPRR